MATRDLSGANNPNYKGYMHRKCAQCGGSINGSSSTRKFCSRNCQVASYRVPRGYKTCPWCGLDFYHRSNTHCSYSCAAAAKTAAAKNPGVKAARRERKLTGLFTGLLGRPPAPRQPRTCGQCGIGFLVRPSEDDRKYCSRACYAKTVGDRQRGENHHNYKDGRALDRISERQRLRRHPMYKQWRSAVFARDEYACRACRQKSGRLHAHHHVPWTDDPKLRLKVSNGITLCENCHRLWHAYAKQGMFSGKESSLQDKVKRRLEEYGFYVFNVPGNRFGPNGVPDLIVCYRGLFGGLEVKVFPNYLSEPQKAQADNIKAAGGLFYVVQSEDDVGRVIEMFELATAAPSAWLADYAPAARDVRLLAFRGT